MYTDFFLFYYSKGSKNQDNAVGTNSDQPSNDGFAMEQDLSDLQALQNHNLLIALGGVAARQNTSSAHFSMPVSTIDQIIIRVENNY